MGSPTSANIEFKNIMYLKPDKIRALTHSAIELLKDFVHPPIQVTELRDKPITSNDMYGYAYTDFRIEVGFTKWAYPVFVHEYGHVAVEASLRRDVPAYAEEMDLIVRLDDLALKYQSLKARLMQATTSIEIDELTDEVASIEATWKTLLAQKTHIYDFSLNFEEVFSDLLVAALYRKKPDLMDATKLSGWRNLNVIEKDPRKKIWGDEHHLLQKIGAHIYLNYLAKENADPKVIFQIFYELIRDELGRAISSGWLRTGPLAYRHNVSLGTSTLNGRDIGEWVNQLIKEFDLRMTKQ